MERLGKPRLGREGRRLSEREVSESNPVAKFAVMQRGSSTSLRSARNDKLRITADLINKYPDRFLFGSDEVAPQNQEAYLRVYHMYDPVWQLLTPEASEKVRKGNYERLFNQARQKVRAWEAANVKPAPAN